MHVQKLKVFQLWLSDLLTVGDLFLDSATFLRCTKINKGRHFRHTKMYCPCALAFASPCCSPIAYLTSNMLAHKFTTLWNFGILLSLQLRYVVTFTFFTYFMFTGDLLRQTRGCCLDLFCLRCKAYFRRFLVVIIIIYELYFIFCLRVSVAAFPDKCRSLLNTNCNV